MELSYTIALTIKITLATDDLSTPITTKIAETATNKGSL